MDVKSQLKEAQMEHTTQTEIDNLTIEPRKSRFAYAQDSEQAYVGDGNAWVQLFGSRIGDIKTSLLEDGVFQSTHNSTWILADGRDITGSDYSLLTGVTTAPDLRGRFLRGKNNSAAGGAFLDDHNPNGDVALGTYESDQNKAHTHSYTFSPKTAHADLNFYGGTRDTDTTVQTGSEGGNEARPRAVTVNFFIKINK